jgi:hypothetical protein
VVPCPEDVDLYEASMPLTVFEIFDSTIPSPSIDIGQHLHPHMECDLPTSPEWVVDFESSHDFLDFEFASEEAILDVTDSIENPNMR